ncbi:IS1634 family transposase [Candidatus Cardinium hertigii]|uniref:IS1634 family transposase n=1 Tax=Candidatus Cardinium hertigii TaxID=247481 RepID=A0A3N2QBB6_9BACT|nr:IS1634 family transposase [Candidatus Cardinium hertigii]ROT47108.1 IS1634 family transposase [Candidatus Cardinium hertigii]
MDTTTLTLYGDYACAETDEVDELKNSTAVAETNRLTLPKIARPAHGYAKNKRFDLKQMTLLLATSGAAHFPIWMEAHAGNAADKTTLEAAATRMQNFCKALESTPSFLYVGDSAMYANCVKYGQNLLWLSRVPDNIKVAKTLLTKQTIDWIELDKGYKYIVVNQIYQGIAQRWALIYSKEAYDKEVVTLEKKIEKEASETNKLLWHLGNQLFGCLQDLDKEILQINKKLHYHKISYTAATIPTYLRKGRPKKDNKPDKIEYKAHTVLLRDEEKIEHATLSKGRFILATNQLDEIALKDSEILSTYKEQSGTESGFKFIKDNSFEVDSIFLKKPGRISALMVVMTLCLMVYSFAQYDLRKQLEATNTTILSQSGYATKKPTMKWIYKLFHGVHLLKIKIGEQYHEIVLNMNDILKKIVQHFGPMACRIYDIEYENI